MPLCSANCIGYFRLALVLCQWILILVGINAVNHLSVPEPRRTPPPPDVQQWTYKVDPNCTTANLTRMVMQSVNCAGGIEWHNGCEYQYFSRIKFNGWWVFMGIAFVVFSCVYAVVALYATCLAHDKSEHAQRQREESWCEQCFQQNVALTFFNGANLAQCLLIVFGSILLLGYGFSPTLRKCAPLGARFDPGILICHLCLSRTMIRKSLHYVYSSMLTFCVVRQCFDVAFFCRTSRLNAARVRVAVGDWAVGVGKSNGGVVHAYLD